MEIVLIIYVMFSYIYVFSMFMNQRKKDESYGPYVFASFLSPILFPIILAQVHRTLLKRTECLEDA